MLDSLRQLDWASRDMRKRQRQVETVTRELAVKLGRNPTDEEVAGKLGVSPERWRKISLELRTSGVVSSTPNPDVDFDREQEFPAAPEGRPDRVCRRAANVK